MVISISVRLSDVRLHISETSQPSFSSCLVHFAVVHGYVLL